VKKLLPVVVFKDKKFQKNSRCKFQNKQRKSSTHSRVDAPVSLQKALGPAGQSPVTKSQLRPS